MAMVVRRGFEPRKSETADLQSALVGHLSISPQKLSIKTGQTLKKLSKFIWSWQRDSNPRPAAYKAAALPTELRQHIFKKIYENEWEFYSFLFLLSILYLKFCYIILTYAK